jgi:hypothetical protein
VTNPHGSPEHRDVGLGNEILRVLVGSGVHGTAIDGQDDRDQDPPSVHECAWAAGIIEGEGAITIAPNGGRRAFVMKVAVGNTDGEMLEFLHRRWGGSISRKMDNGKRHKPYQVWAVVSRQAQRFLLHIYPYLVTARVRTKADLALAFQAQKTFSQVVARSTEYRDRQDAFYYAMRQLNVRGTNPLVLRPLQPRVPMPRGESHHNAKLTARQVAEARARPPGRRVVQGAGCIVRGLPGLHEARGAGIDLPRQRVAHQRAWTDPVRSTVTAPVPG